MSAEIIKIQLPKTFNPENDYCTVNRKVFVTHTDPQFNKGIGSGWLKITHNEEEWGEVVLDDLFLLYDEAGLNYAHFFFNFFGKCLYFDELRKLKPNLKLAIPSDFYSEEGNSTFIKQWLDLYYQDNMPDVFILEKNKIHLVSTLYVPQTLYSFPMSYGDDYIIDKILETVAKVPTLTPVKNGCYISRQDTIKRGWYHSRELENELELIDRIKTDLDYDIIELMDYDMVGKIQIFKSYKNIIQQSSASNVNILFSNKNNTNIIITHPKMEDWLGYKCNQFSNRSKSNLILLNGGGILTAEQKEDQADGNNLAWRLDNIDGIIEVLKQINN
jgi:capsular polysaccharide biosynthesis protein